MTTMEKRQAIRDYCNDRWENGDCLTGDHCPLYDESNQCYEADAEQIHKNYELIKDRISPIATTTTTDDVINHPSHYTHSGMECIDEMEMIFGTQAVMNFCICNAWKYRKRALYKNGEEDMKKSDAYLRCYKSLKENGIAKFES